ncbi:MAG: mechanosensitive ion channel [Bacteroidales bacterium]|nr:mechanosensitive ion channel [Bacteroidales bacterium]
MKKKLLTIVFAILVFSIPLLSVVNGQSISSVLKDLGSELKTSFLQRAEAQKQFDKDYEREHKRMVDIITASNELSLLLYTQEQDKTFDLAYALHKVTSAYKDFSKDSRPYDRSVHELNVEVDRYARLIEALRRLPPVLTEIELKLVPDSLQYHNDSLDWHISEMASTLEKEVIRIAIKDSLASPFVLDARGEIYRDSCIRYASELLKMHADNRATLMADSTHYRAAFWRMKEAYDYAQSRYEDLEKYVFMDGQTSYLDILATPSYYWERVKTDLNRQYNILDAAEEADSISLTIPIGPGDEEEKQSMSTISSKELNAILLGFSVAQLLILGFFWGMTFLLLWILSKWKRLKPYLPKGRRSLLSILIGTFVYFLLLGFGLHGSEYIELSAGHINTFLWLLIAISGSLLLRVETEQIRHCLRLYIPTFLLALFIIVCRISFVPDSFLVFLLPPILAIAVARQLFFSIRESAKATPVDSALGWTSLIIYVISLAFSFFGYTFLALLILVWWYFQLAALLSIFCIEDLAGRYKERWLDRRVEALRRHITYVGGEDRESLLFGATWFYDFIKDVALPTLLLVSLPICVRQSLNVFDFNDLFDTLFYKPFVQLYDKDGFETLCLSGQNIFGLIILFLVLRYLNRAIHTIWRFVRYTSFMRKHNRTSIRPNEINLSLGNSILNVLVWMTYVTVVVSVLKIPMGSLTLIAGGLSAGIGLALKDIINNFIYGIQLLGGRLRVGDWIECDGVRGRVVGINYQCVQVETTDGTEMSFLNTSLFGKNFNNLTRNNSYELTKLTASVAYGTKVEKVREAITEAMKPLQTKDRYGRDIVEPKYGIKVFVAKMADSGVVILVKQYVLVPERISYVDRAVGVIYEALNANGITIPFPQCDIHLIKDDEK